MMFIPLLSWRYAFSQSNRQRHTSIVILCGIAVGMLAMVTMLSLMNSLQTDLLDQVKSIESFHIQVSFPADDPNRPSHEMILEHLRAIDGVDQAHAYVDTQVLVQNLSSNRSTTARMRIIDKAIWAPGNPFTDHAVLVSGSAQNNDRAAFGYLLASELDVQENDEIRITVLGEGKAAVLAPFTVALEVAGIFRTGLPEFDSSTLFADSNRFFPVVGQKRITYGLYVSQSHRISSVVHAIHDIYGQAEVYTWQQVNDAFYSALMLEKTLMYLFLLFMFVILGVNMKNASSRLLFLKRRELAILRALGTPKHTAMKIFLGQAMIITILGEVGGIIGGVLLSNHIGGVFSFLNSIQYIFSNRNNVLLSYPFSTQVRPTEIVVVALSVLLLCVLFTYGGCRKALQKEPMEMLYHV